jgi:hypothetical protein
LFLHKAVAVLLGLTVLTTSVYPQDCEVFERFKDSNGISIDMGAGDGTTSQWLSKNFKHVISIESDSLALVCLKMNLEASGCKNATICTHPIGAKGLTFKQMLFDYVYTNNAIGSDHVSLIKCTMEGGEENVIEDILHFCYHNNCSAYISFYPDRWTSHKISDFEYLFEHFETNCTTNNLREQLENNPFSSILFEPKNTEGLIKKNMPAVIIGYNQVTYIRNMVNQLKNHTSDIIVIDNNSSFQPLLDYYRDEFEYTLLKMNDNHGYLVYKNDWVQKLVGDMYILTDPDLLFNYKLPNRFIDDFIGISNYFKAGRVGFALSIDSDEIRTDALFYGHSIKEWESQFWTQKLYYPPSPQMELNSAPIDTTFCLINKKYGDHSPIRVAGNYTCLHLPWYKNFRALLEEGEYESYTQNNKSTNWFPEG